MKRCSGQAIFTLKVVHTDKQLELPKYYRPTCCLQGTVTKLHEHFVGATTTVKGRTPFITTTGFELLTRDTPCLADGNIIADVLAAA